MIKESTLPKEVQNTNDEYRESVIKIMREADLQPYEKLDAIFQLLVPEVRTYCSHFIADTIDMYQLAPKGATYDSDASRCVEILRVVRECLRATEDDSLYMGGGGIRYYYADKHYRRVYEEGFKLESDLI